MFQLKEKEQIVVIFVMPAIACFILILRNPYIGVYLYFLYSYLRPYDFIPALIPLRLAMVIEITTLLSWLMYLIHHRDKVKWNTFNWFFLGFVTVMGITVATASNNRFAYNMFEAMMVTFAMFMVITNVVDSKARLNRIIWLLLVTHFYFAMKGIYNYAVVRNVSGGMVTSGAVGSSFIGDENDFALALNVMIPFAFFMLQRSVGKLKKLVCTGFLITYVIAVVFSVSRGGWVGLVAVLVFCVLNSKRRFVSIAYALVICATLITVAPSIYWDEIRTITDTHEATAASRLRYWSAAGRMFMDHPIVGVGAGNGGFHMPAYITGVKHPETEWGRAFHGTFPQIIAELGILGTLFYGLMVFYAVRFLLRTKQQGGAGEDADFGRYVSSSLLGALVAYFVCSTFLTTAYYPQLWTLYTLAIVLANYRDSAGISLPESRIETAQERP